MKKKSVIILVVTFFLGCESDDNLKPNNFEKIVNKEWVAKNRLSFECYTFYEYNSFMKVREIFKIDTSTLVLSSKFDTINAYWNLKNDIVLFSNTSNFDAEIIEPTDWKIIQINDTLLEVKYISDMDNPYILSTVFVAK